MKQLALFIVAALLTACGPSPEAVECCECLRGTPSGAMEIVEQDDGAWALSGKQEIAADACLVALDESRLIADPRSWRPGDGYPDDRVTCHEECAAHRDELALAQGRL